MSLLKQAERLFTALNTMDFEWRATGTFTAPLATPGGEVPPNGKTIDLSVEPTSGRSKAA